MATTVIKVGPLSEMPPNVVYIGRSNAKYTLSRPGSVWANPFREGEDGTREQVIRRFEEWFRSRSGMVEKAKSELKGKALACWCHPLSCHGDVLAKIAEEPHITDIAEIDQTLRQIKAQTHYCHAQRCPCPVPPKLLMCAHHWRMVPKYIQTQIWRHYRPGQEQDKRPSAIYMQWMRKAIEAVAEKGAVGS